MGRSPAGGFFSGDALSSGMSHARAAALMVAATLLWSTAGVVARSLERAQSFEVAFWRSSFAAVSMAGILVVIHRGKAWSVVRAAGWPGLLSGLMFSIMFTCFMLAVMSTTVANALVVNSLYPVFAGLLGTAVLGTRLPVYTWVAILAAVGGMVFMFASGLGSGLSGTLIAFAVPVAAAVNVVTLKKWGRNVDLHSVGAAGRRTLGAGHAAVRAAVPGHGARSRVARRSGTCSSSRCPARCW